MQELENVLREIESVGNIQFSSYTKPLIAVEDVIKIICAHISCENAAEIERSSRDNDGWIPAEERLPEESLNSVIGWDEYRERCCFVQYYGGRWILGADREPVNIIAWRPLPEPYHPERSEGE